MHDEWCSRIFVTVLLVMCALAGCERTPRDPGAVRATHSGVSLTQTDFLAIYIAAEQYRSSEGSYPKSLSDLVARPKSRKLLTRFEKTPEGYVLFDVWRAKPLKYVCPGKVWSDAFDVYSLGPNGIDDGGKHDDVASWDLIERYRHPGSATKYGLKDTGVEQVTNRLMQLSGSGGQ